MVRWLLQLQSEWTDPEGIPSTRINAPPPPTSIQPSLKQRQKSDPAASRELHQSPDKSTMWSGDMEMSPELPSYAPPIPIVSGFSGRLNKPADTCYAFWVTASLHILLQTSDPPQALYDAKSVRRYLLALTQHQVMGGFTKFPGDKYADLYHSFLGLAALSLCSSDEERKSDGIEKLDAGMCVREEVRGKLRDVWARWGVNSTDDATL